MARAEHTPLLDALTGPEALREMDVDALAALADELRRETIAVVSETGGHLGAGLGVVELTVALHAVFDTPRDRLIWDVGHQSYPHKILTRRRNRMGSLRQKGGISGFPKRAESPFDPFGAGHSSTSISAALGFAVARDLGGEVDPPLGDAIAVIGDGAMSAGMAFEALNNAGHLGKRLFVILNDNGRSIAAPTGALDGLLRHRPEAKIRLFEALGFEVTGPVDGHDLGALLSALREARQSATGPVLIHVLTQKGKGYGPAEAAPDKAHATAKFDPKTGEQEKPRPNAPSYTAVFGRELTRMAREDNRVCAITAAMPDGTGVAHMAEIAPERVFDVGIAEQHAVTFAAGLAAAGMRPFCAIYSTFLQRAYDQIVHDVALQNLPVRFMIDRAGLVGRDGATHAGAFDLSMLCNLPNMLVMAPADEAELVRMLATAHAHDTGPCAIRYPRGEGTGGDLPAPDALKIGKGRVLRRGRDVAILSLGTRLEAAQEAAEMLAPDLSCTIADARFAKPLDRDLILDLAQNHRALVTLEEGATGGFGAHVGGLLAEAGALDSGLMLRHLTLPDHFLDHASPEEMLQTAELTGPAIAQRIRSLFDTIT